MPVHQIYFPETVSSDILRLADRDKIGPKEWIQKAVGEKITREKAAIKKGSS